MASEPTPLPETPEQVIEAVREIETEEHGDHSHFIGRPLVDAMERVLDTGKLYPGDTPLYDLNNRNAEGVFLWGVHFGTALERSGFHERGED